MKIVIDTQIEIHDGQLVCHSIHRTSIHFAILHYTLLRLISGILYLISVIYGLGSGTALTHIITKCIVHLRFDQ